MKSQGWAISTEIQLFKNLVNFVLSHLFLLDTWLVLESPVNHVCFDDNFRDKTNALALNSGPSLWHLFVTQLSSPAPRLTAFPSLPQMFLHCTTPDFAWVICSAWKASFPLPFNAHPTLSWSLPIRRPSLIWHWFCYKCYFPSLSFSGNIIKNKNILPVQKLLSTKHRQGRKQFYYWKTTKPQALCYRQK